jgi:3-dehydroquinate dehydratase-2
LEGEAINRVYAAAEAGLDALVFNPAGFLHTGYALRDCLAAMTFPCIEVHMSNIEKRGFHSITASAATGMVCGFGPRSYILGIDAALGAIEERGIASQSARSTA